MERPSLQDAKRKWLKAAVESSGLTQAEVARRAEDFNATMLSAMVNGHKPITDDTIDRIAKALKMPRPVLQIAGNAPAPKDAQQTELPKGTMLVNEQLFSELVEQVKLQTRLLNAVLDRLEKR